MNSSLAVGFFPSNSDTIPLSTTQQAEQLFKIVGNESHNTRNADNFLRTAASTTPISSDKLRLDDEFLMVG
jgi:hypothetical protein